MLPAHCAARRRAGVYAAEAHTVYGLRVHWLITRWCLPAQRRRELTLTALISADGGKITYAMVSQRHGEKW